MALSFVDKTISGLPSHGQLLKQPDISTPVALSRSECVNMFFWCSGQSTENGLTPSDHNRTTDDDSCRKVEMSGSFNNGPRLNSPDTVLSPVTCRPLLKTSFLQEYDLIFDVILHTLITRFLVYDIHLNSCVLHNLHWPEILFTLLIK